MKGFCETHEDQRKTRTSFKRHNPEQRRRVHRLNDAILFAVWNNYPQAEVDKLLDELRRATSPVRKQLFS